jgi:uncharacterized membrane protein YfcA
VTVLLAIAAVAVGLAVGVMSAMFGVGGGVVMVPFIVLALDKSQHLAEGTSLLVIVPTAVVGAIAHHKRGYVSVRTGAVLALTGVVGAFAGARLALTLDASALQRWFGGFTILVGAKLLLDGFRKRRAETGRSA